MRDHILLRLIDGAPYWYPPGGQSAPIALGDPDGDAQLSALLVKPKAHLLFAVPTQDLSLRSLQVTRAERRHFRKALPFLIEEALAEDLESVHVVAADQGRGLHAVAVVTHERMQDWSGLLGEFAERALWIPSALLLPWREGHWCILIEGTVATVRHGVAEGFAIETDLLSITLDAALSGLAVVPEVTVYGQDEAADLALLPAGLAQNSHWRRGDLRAALLISSAASPLNLREGSYTRPLPFAAWWRSSRWVAVLLVSAFVGQVAAEWLELRQARVEQQTLRAAMEQSFRAAIPQGAMVDAERQLRRQLDQRMGGGGGGGSALLPLLADLTVAVGEQDSARLTALNYNQRVNEIRLSVLARSYGEVEGLQSRLTQRGLQVELENSSSAGDEVRARLRVRGRG